MKTDHARLARVRSGILAGIGCGKTFSLCHYAADWLLDEDGEEDVANWIIFHQPRLRYILAMLRSIVRERGADVNMSYIRRSITHKRRTIRFIEADIHSRNSMVTKKVFRDHR